MIRHRDSGGEQEVEALHAILDGVKVEVRLSRHAFQRMAERRVSLGELLEALGNPCEHAYDKSKDVALLLGCNKVAVAYVQKGARIEVVTVMREAEYRHLTRRIGRRRYKTVGGLEG
jgi:hypothetical protein